MLLKFGENIQISKIENSNSVDLSPEIIENFRTTASNLKKIAPKADDFLYFSAVMLHSAEASSINSDGSPKLTKNGEPVKVGWEIKKDSWKWVSNDSNIMPFKNANGDIFPETEVIKAYKNWIGKPLCIDHKSSSVDHVRGFIVDTYYDRILKRIVALCALDKRNYPELAFKVQSGYSNDVSMDTAVATAICYDCGRVAKTEKDFCDHMKYKTCYGEINVGLNPIELSIVVNGADPKAKIKHVIASVNTLNNYIKNKEEELKVLANKNYSVSISANEKTDSENFTGNTESFNINTESLKELKEKLNQILNKLEKLDNFNSFRASISEEEKDYEENKLENNDSYTSHYQGYSSSKSIVSDNFEDFSEKLEKIMNELNEVENILDNSNKKLVKNTNDLVSEEENKEYDKNKLIDSEEVSSIPSIPAQKLASKDKLVSDFHTVISKIDTKISCMKKNLDQLLNNKDTKEEIMSGSVNMNKKGYFQGTVEPKDGQQYTPDPENKNARENLDKQMHVDDTGPVDGLYPGDLERKKMVARAQAEERAMRRQAIVDLAKNALNEKQAYFQGGGGENEPTPGKQKYKPDPMNNQLREKEDKQMVGQKPFPDVGDVEGLHPSPDSADQKDELKRKELLNRASYSARFVKAARNDGSIDLGKSSWEVLYGNKLVLKASVNELTGNCSEVLFDSVATKDFGLNLIKKIKTYGAEKVNFLVKSAQSVPLTPPVSETPSSSVSDAQSVSNVPMSDMPQDMPEEKNGKDAPVEVEKNKVKEVSDLATKVQNLGSDLVEVTKGLLDEKNEMGDLKDLSPTEQSSMISPEPGKPVTTASLNVMRKHLNSSLIVAAKELLSNLKDHNEELNMIKGLYANGMSENINKEFVGSVVEDAINDAKSAIADGHKLMNAFVKYARGTEALVKRAEKFDFDDLYESDEQSEHNNDDLDKLLEENVENEDTTKNRLNKNWLSSDNELSNENLEEGLNDVDLDDDKDLNDVEEDDDKDLNDVDLDDDKDLNDVEEDDDKDLYDVEEDDDKDLNDAVTLDNESATELLRKDPTANLKVSKANYNLNTKAGRTAYRAKLASESFMTSTVFDKAHPKGGMKSDFDVKPSDDLSVIETVEETQKKMLEIAKAPVKVRKEAEAIYQLVSEGKLDVNDLDLLVSEGVDKAAVDYYRAFYSQVEGGSEFAKALTEEHIKAKAEEDMNNYRVKIARAYELAYDMVSRGLCCGDRESISKQVEDIMKFNDESFDSLKRVVAKHQPIMQKSAGHMAHVGLTNEHAVSSVASTEEDLISQLNSVFSGSRNRNF